VREKDKEFHEQPPSVEEIKLPEPLLFRDAIKLFPSEELAIQQEVGLVTEFEKDQDTP
jgi:hypothetical protein